MAGLALAIDLLLEKAPSLIIASSKTALHSTAALNSLAAAAAASSAVSFLPSQPVLFAHFHARDWSERVAYCDDEASAIETDAWESRWAPVWEPKSDNYALGKRYEIELKPLFSAFRPRAIGATTLRAILVNYLPLLEAYLQPEDDDLEDDLDRPARLPMDPVVPLKRSATHIVREVSVITTRRVLERVTVHYVSNRMAWKLLKDVPKSAMRKATRHMTHMQMFTAVCKTTFRAHALGVLANWVVQLALDIYRSIHNSLTVRTKEGRPAGMDCKELKRLARRTAGNTLKGSASLILASVGAGLGTVLIRPSTGTWIGCAAGDFAGPFLIGIWLDTWIVYGTFNPGSDRGQ